MNNCSFRILVALAILGLTCGCSHNIDRGTAFTDQLLATQTPLPSFNHDLFTDTQPVIELADITDLAPQQKTHFLNYFHDPINQNTPAHERVANYLGIILDRFTYTEKTFTAETSLTRMSGNCLSLVLITDAFAKLAEVEIDFQLLKQNPVFTIDGDLLITSDHIRSKLVGPLIQSDGDSFGSRRNIRVDYFVTDGLSYLDNLPTDIRDSMYYSNIASELVADNDYQRAFSYARKALTISAENASALNTIGILHRRMGDVESAENIYRVGAERHKDKAVFLRNLLVILNDQSRAEEALALKKQIETVQPNNPWDLVRSGRHAHNEKNYAAATRYYQRALEIAPDLHQVLVYSAIANYEMGRNEASKKQLQHAIGLAKDGAAKSRYELKLEALEEH